jgi:hypothetical protein
MTGLHKDRVKAIAFSPDHFKNRFMAIEKLCLNLTPAYT